MSQITKLGLRCESRNLTLDSTSRDWTHIPPESPEAMPKNMQDLIREFKTLYEEKIKRLDLETSATPEEKLQMKVYALQSYVSDLTNQNQVLVEAVEDLEKEAQHKVSSVGMKLQPSDSIVHERMQQRWSLGRSACSLQPTGDTECRSAASSITPLLQPAGRVPRHPDVPEVELRSPSTAQMDGRPRGHTDPGRTVDVEAQRSAWCPGLSGWPRELDRDSPDQREIVRLEDWLGKAEGEGWRVGAEAAALQTRRRLLLAGGDPGRHAQTGQDSGLQRVRHSEPDAVPQCRDSQGSIERALSVQEKHCQQLSLDNSQLPDSLAALQNKTSAWRVGDLSRSLGQERQPVHDQLQSTKESHQVQDQLQRTNQESPQTLPVQDQLQSTNQKSRQIQDQLQRTNQESRQKQQVQDQLQSTNPESTNQESWQVQDQLQSTNQESQQNQQIQDQLQKANQEVGRLRQELAHLRHTAEKKIQRREVKLAALVKELEERKKLGSDCQKELPCTQSSSERLQRETAQLRAKMEERGRVCAGLALDKERLESDLARGREERRAAHLEVRSREQLIIQLRAEMKATQQTHHRTLEEMSALQREVSRLTEDMGGRQEETCLLRGKVREQEEIAEQKEKERVQLHLQLCGSQQQVRSQAESVRQLTSDLEAVKAAHAADADHWGRRRGQLHSRSEQVSAQLAQSQARLRESEAEVTSLKESLVRAKAGRREAADKAYEGLMKTRDAELESAHRQLVGAREDLKEATACARKHEESVAIFKQKYAVAIEKMQQVQGQADCMEEELCYSQQQLRDSLLATSAAKAQLAELDGQYREMFSQWEHSQEAQAQLTDELQANQSQLRESQAKVGLCEGLVVALNKEVDDLKQQTSMCERELILHRQTHSHPDREHLSLLSDNQQLQKRCSDQVQHLAEAERAILQIRTKLETQSKEKAEVERGLVEAHHNHLTTCRQQEQEVTKLEKEVTRLKLELTDSQRNRDHQEQMLEELQRVSAEPLRAARQEAERLGLEAEVGRAEVQRLQEALQRGEGAAQESQGLRAHARQLTKELEELRGKHRQTVEELSVRAEEEARRTGRRRSEGKMEEERRRSEVDRLQRELVAVSDALQQAVGMRLKAQRERQDVLDQRDALRLELEVARSDNARLRLESQLLLANANRWMSEHRSSNDSLSTQMKDQHKTLVLLSQEKEQLQAANDTLGRELTELRDAAARSDSEMMERLKAQIHEWDSRQEDKTQERETCLALNLSRDEDKRSRLQSNLEAIGMLNQQLSALGGENEGLRRRLQEERSARQRAELLLAPLPPPPLPHPPPSLYPTKMPTSSTFLPSTPPPSSSPSLHCHRRRPTQQTLAPRPDRTGTLALDPGLDAYLKRDLALTRAELGGSRAGGTWGGGGRVEQKDQECWRRGLARPGGGSGTPPVRLEGKKRGLRQ